MSTAIVTGASAGIGKELARVCAQDGYDLVLVARSENQLEALADELRPLGRTVHILSRDLSDAGAPRAVFDEVSRLGCEVEVLVNNAGFGLLGYLWDMPEAGVMEMVRLNVGALTELTRLFLPGLIARRNGYILNVASTAAFQPGPLMAVYYASKAYVLSFSHAVHNEGRRFGVSTTALCPGPTKTEFAQRAGMTKSKLFNSGRAMSAAAVARIGYRAMKRRRPVVVAGKLNGLMAFLTRFSPPQMAASIARKLQEI